MAARIAPQWLELRLTVSPELVEPVGELLRRHASGAVAVEEPGGFNPDEGELAPLGAPVVLHAYLPLDRRAKLRCARIDVGLRLLSLIAPIPPLEERLLCREELEEAWKRGFGVLHVSRALVVRPPWEPYGPTSSETVLTLDPGLAFGTGHHPTTRMCLAEVERHMRPGTSVLDVGTGSGILAIAAALLGASDVLALDTDAVAVRAARRNARVNGVGRTVRVRRGTLPLESARQFHLVLANISARVICDLAGHLVAALAPRGILVASGFLEEHSEEVAARLRLSGAGVIDTRVEEGWATLVTQRA